MRSNPMTLRSFFVLTCRRRLHMLHSSLCKCRAISGGGGCEDESERIKAGVFGDERARAAMSADFRLYFCCCLLIVASEKIGKSNFL